jgi:hypothetical protein
MYSSSIHVNWFAFKTLLFISLHWRLPEKKREYQQYNLLLTSTAAWSVTMYACAQPRFEQDTGMRARTTGQQTAVQCPFVWFGVIESSVTQQLNKLWDVAGPRAQVFCSDKLFSHSVPTVEITALYPTGHGCSNESFLKPWRKDNTRNKCNF